MQTPAQEYTAAEFHQGVLDALEAMHPQTAVFDCDGTLWAPDSGFGFMQWTLAQQAFPLDEKRRAWIGERYRLYEAGSVDEATICGEMVQLYAGLAEVTLREAAQTYFAAEVAPFIFPEMAALIATLRARGTELWAVSSTNRWVVEAGVAGLGIPPGRILAAEVAVEDGIATDRLLAVPTDEAKRDSLVAAGLPHLGVVFGNSIHDAAMLAIARRAFPVNANPALTRLSADAGWRIFRPAAAAQNAHAQT